jgi:flavin reductase (DIM6/NTAB) family NADH-FMN oxidoreductase RutF
MMDPQAKKSALRMVSYGLYVITSATPDDRGAFLCNWLTQCSFEPPLIVVAVENEAHSLKVMRASGQFAVSVLETGQRELAGWFGRHSDKVGDKLAKRELLATPLGMPLLPEALAWWECRMMGVTPAGDHQLVLAEVIDAGVIRDGTPLQLKETGFKYAG